jgi:hypothetical protein
MSKSSRNQKRNSRGEFTARVRVPNAPTPAPFTKAGSVSTPNPATTLVRELHEAPAKTANDTTIVMTGMRESQYLRDISRFETALSRSLNPLKILARRAERKALESDYGLIDWRS